MQDVEVTMPDLSTTADSVRLVKWLVETGDKIKLGQPLCEIETDKATMEVESVASGVVAKFLVQEDDNVNVGQAIAVIQSPQHSQSDDSATKEKEVTSVSGKDEGSGDAAPVAVPPKPARGLFAKNKRQKAVSANADNISVSSTHAIVAKRMLQSKQTVPHFYLNITADAEAMAAARSKAAPRKIVWDAFFVQATAKALEKFEKMKCRFADNKLVKSSTDSVGVAVDIDDDLYVIGVKGAFTKDLYEISDEIISRVEKIRAGDAEAKRLEPANITITNLGVANVDAFFAIVNPPEASILAIGKVAPTPCVADGQLVSRNKVQLTLSVDHRVVSGKYAANFLNSIVEGIENIL